MTVVAGFRLGKDSTGYQLTSIASETGRIHINHGLYGRPGRTERASNPTEPNAAQRAIASLRELHTKKLRQGYTRTLIAPSIVRLNVAEVVPTERWSREAPSPELVKAFVAAAGCRAPAPARPR
ncbi:hypothetical protein AB0H73_06880 [Streptomyces olivoreticuli]